MKHKSLIFHKINSQNDKYWAIDTIYSVRRDILVSILTVHSDELYVLLFMVPHSSWNLELSLSSTSTPDIIMSMKCHLIVFFIWILLIASKFDHMVYVSELWIAILIKCAVQFSWEFWIILPFSCRLWVLCFLDLSPLSVLYLYYRYFLSTF